MNALESAQERGSLCAALRVVVFGSLQVVKEHFHFHFIDANRSPKEGQ
jgi:hypothetical protein